MSLSVKRQRRAGQETLTIGNDVVASCHCNERFEVSYDCGRDHVSL